MNDENVLVYVIYYSLFQQKLIKNEGEIISFLPNNAFGVFSTIRRAHKMNSYPEDIHGCIGYWDPYYHILSQTQLHSQLIEVTYDSVWNDNRNEFFPPIEMEPDSTIEIDFLIDPIYLINNTNGYISKLNTTFTNNTFGIIIQTLDKTKKATYLPKVFPQISWNDLVDSIKNKAQIVSDEFELFAYNIFQIKAPFTKILTTTFFTYVSIVNFSRLLINNLKTKSIFPLAYSCQDHLLQWNSTDDVRNIATLSDLLKYIQLFPDIATASETRIIKEAILSIIENIDQYGSQSISFLGYIYELFHINNEPFCKKLLHDLPLAEIDFEQQELLIGMNKARCKNEEQHRLTFNSNDSIFRVNWIIQATISYNNALSELLLQLLETKTKEILQNKSQIETNYLAVAFEAVCFAYRSQRKHTHLHLMFELLFELEHRKRCKNQLYAFLDETARVDITGHILNGLVELQRE